VEYLSAAYAADATKPTVAHVPRSVDEYPSTIYSDQYESNGEKEKHRDVKLLFTTE